MQGLGTSGCEFDGKSVQTETTTWLEFPKERNVVVDKYLHQKKERNPKEQDSWSRIRTWNVSRKAKHLSKVIWDRSIIKDFTRSISSIRIGKPVLIMNVKVSKDKNISRWLDWENLIYVKWNRIKNREQRQRRWFIVKKEIRCWVK